MCFFCEEFQTSFKNSFFVCHFHSCAPTDASRRRRRRHPGRDEADDGGGGPLVTSGAASGVATAAAAGSSSSAAARAEAIIATFVGGGVVGGSDAIAPAIPASLVADNDNNDNCDEEIVELNKKIYHWRVAKWLTLRIPFDHYSLLAMLDKNKSALDVWVAIVMSLLVSVFAALLLYEHVYDDIFSIVLCFVVASCHYSLIKSVQPDSSSPIHGFNAMSTLSRPVYFCLVCAAILTLRFLTIGGESDGGGGGAGGGESDHAASHWTMSAHLDAASHQDDAFVKSRLACQRQEHRSLFCEMAPTARRLNAFLSSLSVYGVSATNGHLETVLATLENLLLFFPFVFTLGLLPQISTFALCILEQIDIYLFGGTVSVFFFLIIFNIFPVF